MECLALLLQIRVNPWVYLLLTKSCPLLPDGKWCLRAGLFSKIEISLTTIGGPSASVPHSIDSSGESLFLQEVHIYSQNPWLSNPGRHSTLVAIHGQERGWYTLEERLLSRCSVMCCLSRSTCPCSPRFCNFLTNQEISGVEVDFLSFTTPRMV